MVKRTGAWKIGNRKGGEMMLKILKDKISVLNKQRWRRERERTVLSLPCENRKIIKCS